MKRIPLTQGKFALVDDSDFEYLNQWKWHICNGYAARREYLGGGYRKDITNYILMHRLINKTPNGFHTDHIDGNRLNNRKKNLRTASCSQNVMNQYREKTKNKTSIYKGVNFCKRDGNWRVQLNIKGKNTHIGYYKTEIEAAKSYNIAVKKYRGIFARLNEIPS